MRIFELKIIIDVSFKFEQYKNVINKIKNVVKM